MPPLLPWLLPALLLLASASAGAEASLLERNREALLALLPPGARLEVRTFEDGVPRDEVWGAERFADFRAGVAARMGRDYAAAPEGVPGGPGQQWYFCDVWIDAWGTSRANAVGPGLPRTAVMGDKSCWIYGGKDGLSGAFENENRCMPTAAGRICSSSYGFFFPQAGAEHGDSWWSGLGLVVLFPPPFGSVAMLSGLEVAQDL